MFGSANGLEEHLLHLLNGVAPSCEDCSFVHGVLATQLLMEEQSMASSSLSHHLWTCLVSNPSDSVWYLVESDPGVLAGAI